MYVCMYVWLEFPDQWITGTAIQAGKYLYVTRQIKRGTNMTNIKYHR